jgi:hypothetical protein
VKAVSNASAVPRWRAGGYRSKRVALWALLGLAALAAIVAVLVFGPNRNAEPDVLRDIPAQVPPVQVKAPLSDEARHVAIRFIQTAVARENLDEAWTLVGANLRGGLTKKQWTSGDNPIVPYPIDKLQVAPYKIDESFTDSALLEVALIPEKSANVRSLIFFLSLAKVGKGKNAHWVVDNWVPRAAAIVPR